MWSSARDWVSSEQSITVVAVACSKRAWNLTATARFPAGLAGMNLPYTPSGFRGGVTDVPIGTGSCHPSAEAGASSVVSSTWLNLSFGYLFVTVFKTLTCCHLNIQVSIKLCKNNWSNF